MLRLKKTTLLLLSPALLSACAPDPVVIASSELCRSWRHQTVSKDDQMTDGTAAIAEGNNNARTRWRCVYGENRAKS